MLRTQSLIFVALMLVAAPLAAKKAEQKVIVADTPDKFAVLVEAIRQEMAPGKRYEFLSPSNRSEVDRLLDRMASMLERSGSVSAMNAEERAQLMSDQEKVNGILVRNADDRLVCTHVAPVGSHLPVTRCRTVREIESQRANVWHQSDDLNDQQRAFNASENARRFNGNDGRGGL